MKKAKKSMKVDNCNCACREYWTTKCTIEYRTECKQLYTHRECKKVENLCFFSGSQIVSSESSLDNNPYSSKRISKNHKISICTLFIFAFWEIKFLGLQKLQFKDKKAQMLDFLSLSTVWPQPIWKKVSTSWQIQPQHQSTYLGGPKSA